MPRLFTGIEIPTRVAEQLARLRGGLAAARWIDRELYHLTLRFIGDVDGAVADDIADLLSQVRRRRFDLVLSGLDCLGPRQNRVIVARAQPDTALIELQAEHERLLQRMGVAADPRRFQPHVTLARLGGSAAEEVAGYLSLRGGFVGEPFEVERFVLYSAKSGSGGGPYVVEQGYPLV
ncbi:MAG: RNA 2',3'-cyclic phosphodiesterase [Bauldia sp.]